MNDFIPKFEGRVVDGAVVKMSGSLSLDDLSDVVLGIDDRLQVKAMFTVVGVDHKVDKDGNLIRIHTLRPAEMDLDPIPGTDDGILRALPAGFGSKDDEGGDDK